MKTLLPSKLLCRTPAFGVDTNLAQKWEELKTKIEESSPSFFKLIANLHYSQIENLSEKAQFTIWKYFNRSRFRTTPFGSFAGFTPIPVQLKPEKAPLISSEMICHHLADWPYIKPMQQGAYKKPQHDIRFLTNSTFYVHTTQIRYIKLGLEQFELAAVESMPELLTILKSCKTPKCLNKIEQLMAQNHKLDKVATWSVLEQLIQLQLINSELQANITGEDYFQRLSLPFPKGADNYIVAHRPLIEGTFDSKLLKDLPEYFDFLSRYFPTSSPTELEDFKKRFNKRFDQQEINLSKLMDPELGLEYGNLTQRYLADELVSKLHSELTNSQEPQLKYGKLHQFLLKGIISAATIQLDQFSSDHNQSNSKLPNTFSLLFRLYKGFPVVDYAGGATSSSLLGRFTMGNKELEAYGKELTKLEQEANPDVIFFDLAYQSKKKVDNVNRRKLLYEQELPIASWSQHQNPLDLEDIMVSVSQGELLLRSNRLGKRLIPRLASAYNYTLSDLAVYRLLCDVQHQGLLSNMNLDLREYFPNLDYYPRLKFKNIIVSPARWLIPINCKRQKDSSSSYLSELKSWLKDNKITFKFVAGSADQTLSFDPAKENDLKAFLSYCKQQGENPIYISEALFDPNHYLEGKKGERYTATYVADFTHQQCIYPKMQTHKMVCNQQRIKSPGTDWLYFEFYSASSQANPLLLQILQKFIKTHKSELKKWFFIRYTDPSPHLRLRLQLKNPNSAQQLIPLLQTHISPLLSNAILHDFQLKTYQRELERFNGFPIMQIEEFFHQDSIYVIKILSRKFDKEQLLKHSLSFCQELLSHLGGDQDQLGFVKKMTTDFAAELQATPTTFKLLNINFDKICSSDKCWNKTGHLPIPARYSNQLKKLLSQTTAKQKKEKLVADLIHLHINRLFEEHQRTHEAIIYHHLQRILQISIALSNNSKQLEAIH